MSPIPKTSKQGAVDVSLAEWERMVVDTEAVCNGWSLAADLKAQASISVFKNKVELRPGLKGLEIETASFVGKIVVGPVAITIRPKIDAVPLAQLLRYAYGLRDIETFDNTALATSQYGFQDLLILLLVGEVEELVQRGLARVYVPFTDSLDRPRGRLDIAAIARMGGLREARLPCMFHERHVNWAANRIVLAGLRMAAVLASDRDLRHRVLQLATWFDGVNAPVILRAADINDAERRLTRVTAAYKPCMIIIRLLHEMSGSDLGGQQHLHNLSSYLFDMNKFYQRLLSRFLRENLVDHRVQDEYTLSDIFAYGTNSKVAHRKVPKPRPDFAVFERNTLTRFLDAKYRDLWKKELPPDWLYQLSIYALASPSRKSVMLYATMSTEAEEEQIDVRSPHFEANSPHASVILRPVHLSKLAALINPARANQLAEERRQYANELVHAT